jgi:adenylosuccinate synthase
MTQTQEITVADDKRALAEHLGLRSGTGTGAVAVVGLQWGDEGKGKIVDLLTPDFDLVVRYNGGANAGHSVQVGDQRYALHLIPSGILFPDKLNVLGNGVVVDPAVLLSEIADLKARGITIGRNLRISDRAHVVLPYHKLQDHLMDRALGQARGDASKIGTTGRGIGPCYADKALRSTAIRMGDLLDPDALRYKLKHIAFIKNKMLAALAQACSEPFGQFSADQLAEEFADYGRQLAEHVCDTTSLLHESLDRKQRILFEGANATLLDIDHGTYPFVTSSNCSSLGVGTGAGVPASKLSHVLGIVKAYSTRVGGGPMPTELLDDTGQRIRDLGREYGTTTGRPRRCGWLDLVAVKYSATVSGASCIALMLLDVLTGFDKLQVCTGYMLDGKKLDAFPADPNVLSRVELLYEVVPGWTEPIADCRQFDDLPAAAQDYVRMIENFVSVPIVMMSVGPRRDQVVLR